jgi:hypothetical protein
VRLVTATFSPIPTGPRRWVIREGDVEIQPLQTDETDGGLKQLISAATTLPHYPNVTAAGEVVVPTRERGRVGASG